MPISSGKNTYSQLDGSPVRLFERPGGFCVAIVRNGQTVELADLVRCAWAEGAGGEGWRVERSGEPHSHQMPPSAPTAETLADVLRTLARTSLAGRVDADANKALSAFVANQGMPGPECRCGGLNGQVYRSPELAALDLANAAVSAGTLPPPSPASR